METTKLYENFFDLDHFSFVDATTFEDGGLLLMKASKHGDVKDSQLIVLGTEEVNKLKEILRV